MMLAEVAHSIQVIAQDIPVARRQPVIAQNPSQRIHHVVEFAFVVITASHLVLQLIQLLQGASQPVLIAAEREAHGTHVFNILPDVLKEPLPPLIAPVETLALAVIGLLAIPAPVGVAVPTPVSVATPIPVSVAVPVPIAVKIAIPIWPAWIEAAPQQIELVSVCPALGVFNADHRGSTAARIANQLLPPPAVDTAKAEVGRIRRQWRRALKAAPLRKLATEIAQHCVVAANLHLGRPVYNYLDRAPPAGPAPADDARSALHRLCRRGYCRGHGHEN